MAEHDEVPDIALKVAAIEHLLAERGLVDPDAIDRLIELYETRIGPHRGARIVAEAWVDDDFRARLVEDATPALAEFGISGVQGENMVVVENTDHVHNVIVCTLCSCYPWPVLGLPPRWYKSPPYRARVVREPRAVLEEFGYAIGDDVEVRVWDSSAEIRYMVLPKRPQDTDGWTREDLAAVVSRDGMIGTAPH